MLADLIKQEVEKLVQKTKNQLNDIKSVSLAQAWKILDDRVTDVVLFLQTFATDLSKPEKKDQAMLIISDFYDQIFKIVEFPFVPKILQPVIQKFVKQLLFILISSAIDSAVTTLKKTGVIKDGVPVASASDADFILVEEIDPKISDK